MPIIIEKEDRKDKMFYTIDEKIDTLDDLIALGKLYDTKYEKLSKEHYFGLNLKKLSKVVEPLEKLSNLRNNWFVNYFSK